MKFVIQDFAKNPCTGIGVLQNASVVNYKLPSVRGRYMHNYPIGNNSFFRTGGNADTVYVPADIDDLVHFLKTKNQDIPITVIGNLSNTLVTDKGIRGVVIDLHEIRNIDFETDTVKVEAGVQLSEFIHVCVNRGISCCELLYMIPGLIGGALVMNAGTPEFEISNVVELIEVADVATGDISQILPYKMSYRNGNIPVGKIITSCVLHTRTDSKKHLEKILKNLRSERLMKQPIGARTCGSTFKNPPGNAAWELIRKSGCSEMSVGDAVVSPLHCNFIINRGTATSTDILNLIERIKAQVYRKTGILLEEEIKIIGDL